MDAALQMTGRLLLFTRHRCLSGTGTATGKAGDLEFSGGDGSSQFGRGHRVSVAVECIVADRRVTARFGILR